LGFRIANFEFERTVVYKSEIRNPKFEIWTLSTLNSQLSTHRLGNHPAPSASRSGPLASTLFGGLRPGSLRVHDPCKESRARIAPRFPRPSPAEGPRRFRPCRSRPAGADVWGGSASLAGSRFAPKSDVRRPKSTKFEIRNSKSEISALSTLNSSLSTLRCNARGPKNAGDFSLSPRLSTLNPQLLCWVSGLRAALGPTEEGRCRSVGWTGSTFCRPRRAARGIHCRVLVCVGGDP
jgi:hypothetical protein